MLAMNFDSDRSHVLDRIGMKQYARFRSCVDRPQTRVSAA